MTLVPDEQSSEGVPVQDFSSLLWGTGCVSLASWQQYFYLVCLMYKRTIRRGTKGFGAG